MSSPVGCRRIPRWKSLSSPSVPCAAHLLKAAGGDRSPLLPRPVTTARRFNMEVQPSGAVAKTHFILKVLDVSFTHSLIYGKRPSFRKTGLRSARGISGGVECGEGEGPFWIGEMPELPELVCDRLARVR